MFDLIYDLWLPLVVPLLCQSNLRSFTFSTSALKKRFPLYRAGYNNSLEIFPQFNLCRFPLYTDLLDKAKLFPRSITGPLR